MLATQVMLISLGVVSAALAGEAGVAESVRAPEDVAPDTNPKAAFWRGGRAVQASEDTYGKPVPGHRTEVRSRWTSGNLYFLFICPYQSLNLKAGPTTTAETNQLWKWDVAEVFIGWDSARIRSYKEFEISPQGEWVDLDIDRDAPRAQGGVKWDSGFLTAARIDRKAKVWYGVMRIPWTAIDTRPVKAGNTLRVNFYRGQGAGAEYRKIAWLATMQDTFHAPERFGMLRLVE